MTRPGTSAVPGWLKAAGRRAYHGLVHASRVPLGEVGGTAKTTVWQRDAVTMHRYESSGSMPTQSSKPSVLLVHSLVTRPCVFDLRPGNSLVEDLLGAGFDVYLLDWGTPGPADAGNTLESYCDEYLPRAIRHVADASGVGSVNLIAYCLGAVLALISLAADPTLPVSKLVALATPIDLTQLEPFAGLLAQGRLEPDDLLDETGNVPARTMLEGMRLIEPATRITTGLALWDSLVSLERLAAYQALIGWSEDQVPFPGATFRQLVHGLLREAQLVSGHVSLGERTVALSSLRCQVLSVVGDRDTLVPPACTAPLAQLLPSTQLQTVHLPAGHTGLFVGKAARANGVPAILSWLSATA